MKEEKMILLTENLEEQMKVARLINSIVGKIINKKNINDGVVLSFEETQLIKSIVVSSMKN